MALPLSFPGDGSLLMFSVYMTSQEATSAVPEVTVPYMLQMSPCVSEGPPTTHSQVTTGEIVTWLPPCVGDSGSALV